jgi:DNA-binding HxlR family transcriptional regulator
VLVAKAYSQRPPRAVYELTAAGRELAGALGSLTEWGTGRGPAEPEDGLPRCPTCGQAVDDEDGLADEVRFL